MGGTALVALAACAATPALGVVAGGVSLETVLCGGARGGLEMAGEYWPGRRNGVSHGR